MARDSRKNLQLSVNVEYDVQNFKKIPESVQVLYDQVLDQYGVDVIDYVRRFVGSSEHKAIGPGPHPHRNEKTEDGKPEHNFSWEDTGKLGDAVHYRKVSRGYLRTVEIFVDPIEINGRLVDYGTFLEVGWHPLIPIKGGGVRPSGNFYAYPWLSRSLALANSKVMKNIMRLWKTTTKPLEGQIRVVGKGRSKSGTGVWANKFVFNQNITADVADYGKLKEMTGFLKEQVKIPVLGNIFFPDGVK